MKFTKMQGCGNDYIYIDCFRETVEDPTSLAIRLSDRNFGIGGDGIILIKPSDKADFFMDMYNLDGSRGKMCGNAIRCVGKYVYDHKMTEKTDLEIETLSGIKYLKLNPGEDGKIATIRVNMGAPCTVPSLVPVNTELISSSGVFSCECELKAGPVKEFPVSISSETRPFTFVSMGNPHAVTFTEEVTGLPLSTIGPEYEFHKMFPERANIEFVHVLDRSHISFRVWERGSGETKACGTGACASVYASIINGRTDNRVYAKMLGGELLIEYSPEENVIYMTGPATEVFSGEINA